MNETKMTRRGFLGGALAALAGLVLARKVIAAPPPEPLPPATWAMTYWHIDPVEFRKKLEDLIARDAPLKYVGIGNAPHPTRWDKSIDDGPSKPPKSRTMYFDSMPWDPRAGYGISMPMRVIKLTNEENPLFAIEYEDP